VAQLRVSDSKLIMERYRRIDALYAKQEFKETPFDINCGITDDEINEFIDFLDTRQFLIMDIRYRAIKLAMKYEFAIDSFWEFIQVKRGIWKKR